MRSRMLSATPRDIVMDGSMELRIANCGNAGLPMVLDHLASNSAIPQFRNSQSILNQASFSFSASDGAAKNPERKGKQDDEETEKGKKRLRDFR